MQTLLVVMYIAGGVIGTIIFILMLMCLAQRCFSKNPKEYYVSFQLQKEPPNHKSHHPGFNTESQSLLVPPRRR